MYNGPSVSLCFYSQIGSVRLKKNRESRSASTAALAARGAQASEQFRNAFCSDKWNGDSSLLGLEN